MRRRGERAAPAFGFGAALGLAVALTAALVWLLAPPGGEHAAVGAAYRALLWALRACAALAWGLVLVAGLRLLRRR